MRGIDVSSNNHTGAPFNWLQVKQAGYDFVYVKATEGVSYVNPYLLGDVRDAKAHELLVGVYHYFKPGISAIDQANYFLRNGIGQPFGLELDLVPVVDIEENPATRADRDTFCTVVGLCSQYMNRDFYSRLGLGNAAWTWLAWPGYSGQPLSPDVRIVQNGTGRVPGIDTETDLNITIGNQSIELPKLGVTDLMDNITFIHFLYRFLLYRAPDPAGLATWNNELNGGAQRGEVWAVIQNSPEGVAALNAQRKALGMSAVTAP